MIIAVAGWTERREGGGKSASRTEIKRGEVDREKRGRGEECKSDRNKERLGGQREKREGGRVQVGQK